MMDVYLLCGHALEDVVVTALAAVGFDLYCAKPIPPQHTLGGLPGTVFIRMIHTSPTKSVGETFEYITSRPWFDTQRMYVGVDDGRSNAGHIASHYKGKG